MSEIISREAVEVECTKHHLDPEVTQRLLQIQIQVSNTLLGDQSEQSLY